MAALIIETNNPKSLKLIAELANQLGSRVKSISVTDMEDVFFCEMIDKAKTGEYVSTEFYRNHVIQGVKKTLKQAEEQQLIALHED